MSNRAFRRMIAQRQAYLNYSSPVLDRLNEKTEELEQEQEEQQEQTEPIQYAEVTPAVLDADIHRQEALTQFERWIDESHQADIAYATPKSSAREIIYREKLDNLRAIWHNYKELFYEKVESDDERFDELYEYHRTIEKILSEKC